MMQNELGNNDNGNLTEGRFAPSNPWDAAIARQKERNEEDAIAQNQRMFDGFATIETKNKQAQLELDQQRAIAGASMMMSAFQNGGMSHNSLSAAYSQALGKTVLGGQFVDLGQGLGRGFVLYGGGKDAQGNATVKPVGVLQETQMLKVLQAAKLGDRTMNLQKQIYGSLASRYTTDQLDKMGVVNPNLPSTGSTTISGGAMRALRGESRTPSRIETFAADGKGGFSKAAYDRKTGENWQVDYGERSPDKQGKWKSISSGTEGEVYVNDKTGEKVSVPKGSNLRDALQGATEKTRVAQIVADGRRDVAQTQAAAAKEEREAAAAEKAAARREALRAGFIGDMAKSLAKNLQNAGVPEDQIGAILKTRLGQLLKQYDKYMGAGGDNADEGDNEGDDVGTIKVVKDKNDNSSTAEEQYSLSAENMADEEVRKNIKVAKLKERQEEKKKQEEEEAKKNRPSRFQSGALTFSPF